MAYRDTEDSQGRPPLDLTALEAELDEKYPNRPHNHSETLPFHVLFEDLFNPLNENKKKPTGPSVDRRRKGPHSGVSRNPQEVRRAIIERFISRWRQKVGDDIYPAFRLIIPEKDRERAMYGLKEKVLGRFLVKIMKIDKNSEDGFALLNWKLPGQNTASRMAGDFAGRCFEVLQKRPLLVEVGSMTIEEVNEALDRLAAASKEESQLLILEDFYRRMNPEELMWLIRIILRQMKVGATEKTIFELWHPDAESLFNVSSSLRRVCWELYDSKIRLESEERGVNLMQCFQPQLAQFQVNSFARSVEKMRPTEQDPTFWVEEKLDGERMQLHMISDDETPGGKRFAFWSRKAKDYTYLYGNGFQDTNGALTRHLKAGFRDGVANIILDGEMITWDPETDLAVAFGSLKTAALSEQRNPYASGHRPLYRVFDILYLNDQPLTRYMLRDRRKALERSIVPIHRRFELHTYQEATSAEAIEPMLRDVVAKASEGLVLKNPRSAYRLNERNDDWIKVKPEYMTEFGESLDCLVIGGYYGSGRRGGGLSSFLCGLRVDESHAKKGEYKPDKFHSFFKVGGGLTANDYANIKHKTEGHWIEWDRKRPPTEYVELGGADMQCERPDVWIKPQDSFVIEVKAASVSPSEDFRVGITLRFPRFTKVRNDKSWETALSIEDFLNLKKNAEKDQKDKEMKLDEERRKKRKLSTGKRQVVMPGYAEHDITSAEAFDGPRGKVFDGLCFYIMTESTFPEKKSKLELERMVQANGGKIVQTHTLEHTVCVAERRTVKVASLEKRGDTNIIKPVWLFDCIKQSQSDFAQALSESLLPFELTRHLYFAAPERQEDLEMNADQYGDSYARDTDINELRSLMEDMGEVKPMEQKHELVEKFGEMCGWLFVNTTLYFDPAPNHLEAHQKVTKTTAKFAGAAITDDINDEAVTHVVVHDESDLKSLRKAISKRLGRYPRVVTSAWVGESWKERTRLAEERFIPS